jgi:hypothetical protein
LSLSLYSLLGLCVACVIATASGIRQISIDDEFRDGGAFVIGFILGGVPALAGLTLGASLRLLLQPRWK